MGYVARNLLADEQVLHTGRIHVVVFAPALLLLATAGAFLLVPEQEIAAAIAAFFLLFAGISLLRALIRKTCSELVVTNRRLMVKLGLVGRRTFELSHEKVEGIRVQQGILGRILGYGTVFLCGSGGGVMRVPGVADPVGFRREATRLMDAQHAARAGR